MKETIPQNSVTNVYQVLDNVSYAQGNHCGEIRR
jgi:hypothetical protein